MARWWGRGGGHPPGGARGDTTLPCAIYHHRPLHSPPAANNITCANNPKEILPSVTTFPVCFVLNLFVECYICYFLKFSILNIDFFLNVLLCGHTGTNCFVLPWKLYTFCPYKLTFFSWYQILSLCLAVLTLIVQTLFNLKILLSHINITWFSTVQL